MAADITGALVDYLTGGNIRAYAKTNLGPYIPIYTGDDQSGSPGILSRLGIRGGIIVTDAQGNTLQTIGDPAPTDPIRSLIFWLLLACIIVIFFRGFL